MRTKFWGTKNNGKGFETSHKLGRLKKLLPLVSSVLTLPVLIPEEKRNLNVYFHSSKGFLKACQNKNLS